MNVLLRPQSHQLDANEDDDTENGEDRIMTGTSVSAPKPEQVRKAPSEKSTETVESSGTTNSDLRDVLNCLKRPRDILHLCPKTCSAPKKEECTFCREAYTPVDDTLTLRDADTYSSQFSEYQPAPKPVRINMVHIKDCLHEHESKVPLAASPAEETKWCYCEEAGTSSEEDNVVENAAFNNIGDTEAQGILKYGHPRYVEVSPETGAIDWDKVSMKNDLQDILNCMFPPLTFSFEDRTWIQEVSSVPAKRAEVIKLVELVDLNMKEHQGNNYSIDHVRRQIFDELFDELVRQETIVCAERGLLLLRLRDEMRMTVASWESLLDHGNNFAMKYITSTAQQLEPLQNDVLQFIYEVEEIEKELESFWSAQHLQKLQDNFKKELYEINRKRELAPLIAKYKMLKDQCKLLLNREQDDGTSKSYFS